MTANAELDATVEARRKAVETLSLTVEAWKRFSISQNAFRRSLVDGGMTAEEANEEFRAGLTHHAEGFKVACDAVDALALEIHALAREAGL